VNAPPEEDSDHHAFLMVFFLTFGVSIIIALLAGYQELGAFLVACGLSAGFAGIVSLLMIRNRHQRLARENTVEGKTAVRD